jgi:tRNA pseudouridine38-40 synthase
MRYKLLLEYEGTRYSGWQLQKDSRSIQGELYSAARQLFGNQVPLDIQGAGRTDAGVHALGQVAHLDVPQGPPPAQLLQKLNELLPHDINLLQAAQVHPSFHARHSAVARSYTYQIAKRRSAFAKKTCWWVRDPLDGDLMQQAIIQLEGMHDFRAFTDDNPAEKSTQVELLNANVFDADELWVIRLVGSHFLWKMVRRIVGLTVEIGRGKQAPHSLLRTLQSLDNRQAKNFTAPPAGLFLENVYYEEESIEYDLNRILW